MDGIPFAPPGGLGGGGAGGTQWAARGAGGPFAPPPCLEKPARRPAATQFYGRGGAAGRMPAAAFEATIRAGRRLAFGVATDHAGLAAALPGYFASVRTRSSRGGVSVLEERLRIGGEELLMTVRHSSEPLGMHAMSVLGGDIKGSRIVERYEDAGGGDTLLRVSADIRPGRLGAAAAAVGFGRARAVIGGLGGMYEAIAEVASEGREDGKEWAG